MSDYVCGVKQANKRCVCGYVTDPSKHSFVYVRPLRGPVCGSSTKGSCVWQAALCETAREAWDTLDPDETGCPRHTQDDEEKFRMSLWANEYWCCFDYTCAVTCFVPSLSFFVSLWFCFSKREQLETLECQAKLTFKHKNTIMGCYMWRPDWDIK